MAGRPIHTFDVIRTEQIAPHMVRVILGGNGFDTFTPSEFTDSYVKVVVVPSGVDVDELAHPLTIDSFRLDAAQQPMVRTYTVRRADPDREGDRGRLRRARRHGVAGPWAGRATRGRRLSDGSERCLLARPRRRLAPVRRR